jgi:transposase
MKPYSQDLRERVIAAVEAEEQSQPALSKLFSVSLSFVEKLLHRWRKTSSGAAFPHGGGHPRTLKDEAERIRAEVARQPDVTLNELCDRIAKASGVESSPSMMCRELQRLNLRRKKKSLHDSERDTPRVQALRQDFEARLVSWLAKHLKFIDETGIHLGMTRLYGRALPGERVVDAVPSHSGQHFTLLATIGLTGVSAPWVLEGAVDGAAFEVYVRDVLGPTLVSGDIVLMDNLSAHKAPAITAVIMAHDARVEFLPPYSSDWNPIEQCWSKIKTVLRTAKSRTFDELIEALKTALASITEQDARAWFAYCGYPVNT